MNVVSGGAVLETSIISKFTLLPLPSLSLCYSNPEHIIICVSNPIHLIPFHLFHKSAARSRQYSLATWVDGSSPLLTFTPFPLGDVDDGILQFLGDIYKD